MKGVIIPNEKINEVESFSTDNDIIEVMFDNEGRPFIDSTTQQYLISKGLEWLSPFEETQLSEKPNPFNR